MKIISLYTFAVLAAGFGMGANAQEPSKETLVNPYGNAREERPVVANPYDTVAKIQKSQTMDDNELKIRQLYQQSASSNYDATAKIRDQMARIKATDIDVDARYELMNLDSVEIEVERISADEAQRDVAVPSLSMIERGDETFGKPKNLFLNDWELTRTDDGETIVGRVGDPLSRLNVRVGMILGEFGRIMAVRDTGDAFYLVLESGDRIQGKLEGWNG